jgi:hypothetical protein
MDAGNVMIWQALKLYLPNGTRLTSVRRTPGDQLAFIKRTAEKHGYKFKKEPTVGDEASWNGALDFIRRKGYDVAAPGRSMHQRGLAYDLVGNDLEKIKAAVLKASAEGRIHLIRPPLLETKNKCVHVEIDSAVIDFEPFDWA